MSRIRVAILEGGSGYGGSAYSLRRMARVLSEEFADRIRAIYFVHSEEGAAFFRKAGLESERIESGTVVGRFLELRRRLHAGGFSLLHCNNEPCGHLPYILAARSLRIPVTVHIRGNRPYIRRERLLMRGIERAVTVSESGRDLLLAQTPITADRVCFVGDGVDLPNYAKTASARAQIRESLELTPGTFAILLAATLQPGKGQDLAVEAAAKINNENVTWMFAGGEHYQFPGFAETLHSLSRERGVQDRIRFLGHREDMPDLLAACDAVVLPSILREGMPCTIMEAFAAGKPVIASRIGGIPEAVDERVGLLVEPGSAGKLASAVRELAADPERTEKLGRAALERACERYDVRQVARKVAAVFEEVAHTDLPGEKPE
jgi:glycosyltransferase involved in cell wall biosynthesis